MVSIASLLILIKLKFQVIMGAAYTTTLSIRVFWVSEINTRPDLNKPIWHYNCYSV